MKLQQMPAHHLVMTHALATAIHLLQLPQLELAEALLAEIERNPLLELDRLPSPPPLPTDLPAPTSLRDSLIAQAREAIPAMELPVALHLIDLLDDRGFLPTNLSEEEKKLLPLLQTFDPPGLFATSLQESLFLQLKARGKLNTLASRLVKHHFDDLLQGRWTLLQRKLRIHPQSLQSALKRLSELRLRLPSHLPSPSSVPDFILEEDEVHLDESHLPEFHLKTDYDALKVSDPQERSTLNHFRTSGRWLLRCLSRRRRLLLDVATRMLAHQKEFLLGESKLKPLTLEDLSRELGVHPSTVSRAVADKTLLAPRGLISLKSLLAREPKKKFTGSTPSTKL